MARTFRRQRTAHAISELNVTNLIDLGFTLLIIFMIATPLINQEQTIPVNLPVQSVQSQSKDTKDEFQPISIDRQGNYYFGNRRLTFNELSRELATLAGRPKPPVIRIRADLALQWQQVVRLMDLVQKHNLTRVTFDTQTTQ